MDINLRDDDIQNIEAIQARTDHQSKVSAALDTVEAAQVQETARLESGEDVGKDDPQKTKDPSKFGIKENLQELQSAVIGAGADELSSVLTARERFADMASGEMEREIAEKGHYRPDWDPMRATKERFQTRTKWGNMLRGVLGYATFALPVAGIAGKIGKGVGIISKTSTAAKVARGTLASKNVFVAGATQGALHDVISENSQGDNVLGSLREVAPWLNTPLSTQDYDSPWVKTFKNVVEGMGLGIIMDGAFHIAGRGIKKVRKSQTNKRLKEANPGDPVEAVRESSEAKVRPEETGEEYADRKIRQSSQSKDEQIAEQAKVELESPDFGASKNSVLAEDHQGNAFEVESMYDLSKQKKRVDTDLHAENGTIGNPMTKAERKRYANEGGLPEDFYVKKTEELLGAERMQQLMRDLPPGVDERQVFKNAYLSYLQAVEGNSRRRLMTEKPIEFWKQFEEAVPAQTGAPIGKPELNEKFWSMQNVVAADLINANAFGLARDLSRGTLEMIDDIDIRDIDGPLENIKENLIVGYYNTRRSRFLISNEFRTLKAQDPEKAARTARETLDELKNNTKNQVNMIIDMASLSDDDQLMRGILDAFSMSNKIENWEDFDAFMRRRLKGGEGYTGNIVKELQGVMINSVLSGPKTPLRAILGTSTAVFTRPLSQMLGGIARYVGSGFQDSSTMQQSLASANAMVQTVPEAWQYFMTRVNGYFSGELHTMRTRYAEYDQYDEQWKAMGQWIETRGTDGDKAAYRITNLARAANQNNFLTYSTKLMAATDDAFTMILARARAKERAMQKALADKAAGSIMDINPQVVAKYEDELYKEIFDPIDGSVSDKFLEAAKKEATLTKDISGFGKSMDEMFSKQPLLKPFYLFARTGINGLELSFKHVPGLNLLVKEFRDIATADPSDLRSVNMYGIDNIDDLRNAQALQMGRLALGSSVIFMASQHYLNGNLTGNGPTDFQARKVKEDAGWVPRSIKLGGVWVSYDSLEPFSNILASIADFGDSQRLMGNEYVEKGLLGNALILAKGMVTKTYLQGLNQLVDLFGNDPKKLEKIVANLANNTMPLSSLRNEIGRVITPYTRELQSGFEDSLRNRNLLSEQFTTDPLPIKYDILTGNPIKDWDPLTRMFNAISPIQFNLDQSEGRKFLFRSNYDMRMSTMTAPDGTDLSNSPKVRSKFQQAIGKQRLDLKLEKLRNNPTVIESMEKMEAALARGDKRLGPLDYPHNKLIHKLFTNARKKAWAQLRSDPEAAALRKAESLYQGARKNVGERPTMSQQQLDAAQNLRNLVNR